MSTPNEHGPLGYLVPEFPNQTHAFFWREVQGLREAGQTVHLFSTRRPGQACLHEWADEAANETAYVFPPTWLRTSLKLLANPRRFANAVGYVLGLGESSWGARARLLGMIPSALELVEKTHEHHIQHIHVHSCAGAAHLAALAKILGGPRYSLTLHGDLPVYGTDHVAKMSGAAFVSTVTRPLQAQVAEAVGLPHERIPVITMGVDTRTFKPKLGPRKRRDALVLTTIARLNETKGHVHALRAIKRCLDDGLAIEYRVAGEGPHREVIEAEIEKLGLEDHVHLLGSLPEADVRQLLEDCDAFVLPSFGLGEAAPVSVMEAMSCGLPVVCSIIGGTQDMITHESDGLLTAQQNEDELTQAFATLCKEPETRRRLGAAARERAVDEFDYRRVSFRLLDRIRSCA